MSGPYDLWAWLGQRSNGQESILCCIIPGAEDMGPMLLQSPDRSIVNFLGQIAQAHAESTGTTVRLAHLIEVPEP